MCIRCCARLLVRVVGVLALLPAPPAVIISLAQPAATPWKWQDRQRPRRCAAAVALDVDGGGGVFLWWWF